MTIVWRVLPFGGGEGGGVEAVITGTPEPGQTLHVNAPDGAVLQWLKNGAPISGATTSSYLVGVGDAGAQISCRVSKATAAVDVPPGALTNAAFFGDSFTAGSPGPSDLAHRFSSLAAGLLGVTEDNFGVGGARQALTDNQILTQIYQHTPLTAEPPYAPTFTVGVVQVSINNLNNNSMHNDLGIVTRSLRRAIERLRAGGSFEAHTGAEWTFDGSWSNVTEPTTSTGGGIRRASANGATWGLAVPDTFPGGTLRFYGYKLPGYGAVETFTVDGVEHGSVDNRGSTIAGAGGEPWEYRIALSPGAHDITGVVSSISSFEWLNGADFEAGQKPLVIVLNTARAPAYPGSDHPITDQDVADSNAAVTAMISTVYGSDNRVVLVDIDAVLNKDPSRFGVDQIHPNDIGAALIAQAIADEVNAVF